MGILSKSKELFRLQDSKSKVVVRNIFFSFFIKGINISVSFLTIPLVLTFLNNTQYGIWLTLTAIIGWFALFDLGFGNGLRNHLTTSISKNDFKEGRIFVSTTYAALSLIFGALIILFLIVHPFINWVSVFNAPKYMTKDLNSAVVFAMCFLFTQFIVRLINTVLLSFQRSAMADFTNSMVQVFILIGLFLLKIFHYNSLTSVALVYSITPVVIFVLVSAILFLTVYKNIRPSLTFVKLKYASTLLKLGINFFVIQIAALVLYASDNFIIAHMFEPSEVTVYNISFKYFSIVSVFFTIALSPFWSMTTQAKVEGDWKWIRGSVKKLLLLWGTLAFCGVIQLLVATPIYKIWTNGKVVVPVQLSFMMCFYFIVSNWCAIYSNFLNAVGKVRVQLYLAVFGMIVNIPLAIFLVKVCHVGVIGIPIATVTTMLCASVVAYIQYKKIINSTAKGVWNR
ncbi:O-antigen/teichoic acid export membrane protein [Pedobacter sp. UYP24]